MGGYQVDPAQLRHLAARLSAVAAAVESTPRSFGATASSLGSDRLAARLDDVTANWSERRAELVRQLTSAAGAVEAAAVAYADTDAGVARAAAR